MSCKVIKRINGNCYLYEQTSVRVEGKVVTTSKYLGPVGNGMRASEFSNGGSIELVSGTSTSLGLKEYGISTNKIDYNHSVLSTLAKARSWGDVKPVKLKYAVKGFSVRKSKAGFTITLPRDRKAISKKKLEHEIYRCQGRSGLAALKKGNSKSYQELKERFQKYDQQRNQALRKWWRHTQSKNKITKATSVGMGNGDVFSFFKGDAKTLGLIEKRKFGGFEDQCASIYANLVKKGTKGNGYVYTHEVVGAYWKIENKIAFLNNQPTDIVSNSKRKQKRDLKRAKLQLEAIDCLYRQVKAVEKVIL